MFFVTKHKWEIQVKIIWAAGDNQLVENPQIDLGSILLWAGTICCRWWWWRLTMRMTSEIMFYNETKRQNDRRGVAHERGERGVERSGGEQCAASCRAQRRPTLLQIQIFKCWQIITLAMSANIQSSIQVFKIELGEVFLMCRHFSQPPKQNSN